MKVLVTNDDGFESPGLRAMVDRLSVDHDVWVVAPESERSGTSHSISLHGAVRIRELEKQLYSCSGTPADCVLFSFLGAIPVRPDVVVSGINLGPNLGTDIIYSGTVAAARQAALMGHPSVAISVDGFRPPFHFEAAADFIRRNLRTIVERWGDDHFLNVNFPNVEKEEYEVVITHPARRIYRDKAVSFVAPNQDVYYFLEGTLIESDAVEDSDSFAVSRGDVSVSPVFLHPVKHADSEAYKTVDFR
ncbi:MAG TPA: 5'/3'-nucleotidase SurE [Spirochaetia bacterium]|nr:5'/3'-nucleotidase SurE [Spirochaetia bacterium]